MQRLSSVAELERDGNEMLIRGCGCPLAVVVKSHPQIFQLAAELLSGNLKRDIQERCQRDEGSPRCCFVVA
jgi:predicted ArsR family transcriptional regulator